MNRHTLYPRKEDIQNQISFEFFYIGRVLEVFIEAAPGTKWVIKHLDLIILGGGLQLYYLILKEDSRPSIYNPSFVSIVFSIISIGFGNDSDDQQFSFPSFEYWGVEEAVGMFQN